RLPCWRAVFAWPAAQSAVLAGNLLQPLQPEPLKANAVGLAPHPRRRFPNLFGCHVNNLNVSVLVVKQGNESSPPHTPSFQFDLTFMPALSAEQKLGVR